MIFLLAVLLLLPLQPPGVSELVDGVSRTYSKMKDFSAEFEEISQNGSNQKDIHRGLVYLKSGRRLFLDYQAPEKKAYYSDGTSLVSYFPAIMQARKESLKKSDNERLQWFQIPWNPQWKDQFASYEEPREAPLKAGNRLVRLISKKKEFPVILLELEPATFLIQRFVVMYADEPQQNFEFRFKGIKTTAVDPALFIFKTPPGVDVVNEK